MTQLKKNLLMRSSLNLLNITQEFSLLKALIPSRRFLLYKAHCSVKNSLLRMHRKGMSREFVTAIRKGKTISLESSAPTRIMLSLYRRMVLLPLIIARTRSQMSLIQVMLLRFKKVIDSLIPPLMFFKMSRDICEKKN